MYMYKPNNMVLDHVVIIDVGSVQVSFYSLLRKLGFPKCNTCKNYRESI